MSNLNDDYRILMADLLTYPQRSSRWLELLTTTEKVLNKYPLPTDVEKQKDSRY